MPAPLCETCVHRDRVAGGRGDCVVRWFDTVDYGLIATGVQRYCAHAQLERVPVPVPPVHPDQLELKL